MEEKLPSQRLSVCHMEIEIRKIQMRKIQAAQRVPCLNIRVDVQFILAKVCYTFVDLGNSFILMRRLVLDTSEYSLFH